MKLTKKQQAEKAEAAEQLRKWLKPGDTVRTILRSCSRSGMQRVIGLVIIPPDGSTLHPNHSAALVTGYRKHPKSDGIVMGGCGMDMGFQLVYSLGRALWPDGYTCPGERCRASDHNNPPRPERDGKMVHKDGGYALRHEWL